MIEGAWNYIWGAYAFALVALFVLTLAVTLRYVHWSKRARDLEQRK